MADTTGDGRADIVGFGNAGVYVSRAQANGTFSQPQLVVGNFGYVAGGWDVDRHPRFWLTPRATAGPTSSDSATPASTSSRAQANGTFTQPQLVVGNFGYVAGGWGRPPPAVPGRHDRRRPGRHRRVRRRRRLRLPRPSQRHVHPAATGGRQLRLRRRRLGRRPPSAVPGRHHGRRPGRHRRVRRRRRLRLPRPGQRHVHPAATGRRQLRLRRRRVAVDRHPRFLADTTGDGRADIVGFGDAGVYVSRAQANGTFTQPQLVVGNFGYVAGGWDVDRHPRILADITADGRADIVGFGDAASTCRAPRQTAPSGSDGPARPTAMENVAPAPVGAGAASGRLRLARSACPACQSFERPPAGMADPLGREERNAPRTRPPRRGRRRGCNTTARP